MPALGPQVAHGDSPRRDVADYFGFTELEVVKIDHGAGPVALGDMNGDGLTDLIAINNYKSRIEIHYQKENASPDDVEETTLRTNEFPPHWRFRRQFVTVSHRVGAIVAHDYDEDGMTDLIYGGQPSEIVFLRQTAPGDFEVDRRHRVKNLQPNKDSLKVGDVIGDHRPELAAIADGKINIWSIDDGAITRLEILAAGAPMVAFWLADLDGNGRADISAAIPDDPAPLRLWMVEEDRGRGIIGPQLRFEMPPLVEAETFGLPGRDAAQLAVIERPSKRIVIYDVEQELVKETGDRDAVMRIYGFTDPDKKDRDVAVVDADGDGLLDLVASDTESSAVVVYRQASGKGLQRGESHPSLAEITALAAANVDDDPYAEVFVLSEKESVVGRSDIGPEGVEYPSPITIPDGKTPVAMNLLTIDDAPVLAIALKDGRKYSIALVQMTGESEEIDLGSLSRSPDSIVGLDADQDGRTDLLLLTRDKPMTMLHRADSGFELKESKDMGQFGLVQAATSENTAIFDVDGDEKPELLIADRNFVRAARFNPNPPAGVSPGWQVVRQINARSPDSKLVAIAVSEGRIIAADKENSRLVIFSEDTSSTAGWRQREALHFSGFTFDDIYAGPFSGDGSENILAIGTDGFAVIRLAGQRTALKEANSWRTDVERRFQHELTAGDINSDGFTDLVSLDAGEQMLEIFTFTETGRLVYATGFQVFESRLFTGGEAREFEPSQCAIGDVTGDGAADVVLLAHDRVLIYPQMTKTDASKHAAGGG